jgi:Xaa-Pro aminopeptidase
VLVLFSAPVTYRNNDVENEYRQDSDFYYLTGFDEPESVVILNSCAEPRSLLFLRERDPARETWNGPRLGVEAAVSKLGIDEAFPITALDSKLLETLANCERLFFTMGLDSAADNRVLATLRQLRLTVRRGGRWPSTIIEPGMILHEMRLHKESHEIASLERAIDITDSAHRKVLESACPGNWEYELEAILRAEFRRLGAERVAYAPIVASGVNATVMHHNRNDRRTLAGELVLVDAGCEYHYQSADVTRTFPVSGHFQPLQRAAYEIVLRAQEKAISSIKPGVTLDEIHALAVHELVNGLRELRIITESVDDAITSNSYKKYYMHRTSHWLGMDVHDVGAYQVSGTPRPLEENMVITVEPGLYFPPDDDEVPSELRGTGIRIEDNILVTASGFRNLSLGIPKSPDAIESFMNSRGGSSLA